jgi:hypothetical protein
MSNLGAGNIGFQGIAPPMIGGGAGKHGNGGMIGGSERSQTRFSLVQAWNGQAATGRINGYDRKIGPFRVVNNAGDFLSRQNYTSGGSNQVNNIRRGSTGYRILGGSIQTNLDNTQIPSSSCNPKFVYDGSDYIKFKKLQSINRNYNDYAFGGDDNNASQVAIRRVRV